MVRQFFYERVSVLSVVDMNDCEAAIKFSYELVTAMLGGHNSVPLCFHRVVVPAVVVLCSCNPLKDIMSNNQTILK